MSRIEDAAAALEAAQVEHHAAVAKQLEQQKEAGEKIVAALAEVARLAEELKAANEARDAAGADAAADRITAVVDAIKSDTSALSADDVVPVPPAASPAAE